MDKNKKPNLTDRCFTRIVLLFSDDDFSNDIKKIRKKYNIDISDKEKKFNFLDEKNSELDKDIYKLRSKHNLSPIYQSVLIWVIVFGTWPTKDFEGFVDIKCEVKINDYGENVLYLPIYPETTKEDVERAWPKIKNISKKFYGYSYERQKLYKNLRKDIIIRKMKGWGISHKRIVTIYNRIFSESKAIGYSDVAIIINKMKKKIKKDKEERRKHE
jgi:hypothetical protein